MSDQTHVSRAALAFLRALEAEGLVIVEKARLEALERLEKAAEQWKQALDTLTDIVESTEPDGTNYKYSANGALKAEDAFNRAENALKAAVEAMERG
ncbi:MAG: hypothetical protein K6T83_14320 [Alicyclobacillus sp.]|nr:hypothetical protein [Alicyclobacillus sp.]